MRRRERSLNEFAPITIYVDLFASAAFSSADIQVRGAAILALTRILTAHRVVTLYVGLASSLFYSGKTLMLGVKIDTTPLDLARAAYALCGASFIRRAMLSALDKAVPGSSPWPPFRGNLAETLTAVFGEGTQMLVLDGAIVAGVTKDPEGWIEARLRQAAPEVLGERGS
jgi:hypothetical protein